MQAKKQIIDGSKYAEGYKKLSRKHYSSVESGLRVLVRRICWTVYQVIDGAPCAENSHVRSSRPR
jgi:hypothetical protein